MLCREHGLGTNPICCAANGSEGKSFVLDMATTSVAQGKVQLEPFLIALLWAKSFESHFVYMRIGIFRQFVGCLFISYSFICIKFVYSYQIRLSIYSYQCRLFAYSYQIWFSFMRIKLFVYSYQIFRLFVSKYLFISLVIQLEVA